MPEPTAAQVAQTPDTPRAPTESAGAADASRQRAAFPAQEQLRLAEIERQRQAREAAADQRRRDEILAEIARRGAENRAKIEAERRALAERKATVEAACDKAYFEGQVAEYAGELPPAPTRRLLAACEEPRAVVRLALVEEGLPAATAAWEAVAEAKSRRVY